MVCILRAQSAEQYKDGSTAEQWARHLACLFCSTGWKPIRRDDHKEVAFFASCNARRLMHEPHFLHNRQISRQPHTLPDEPSVELVITSGRARKRIRRVIGPVFLIGSSMDCDLILGDPLVPAVHSYVLMTAYGVRLRHLGESPEVRINGQTLEVSHLADQDQIDIGCFSFLVHIKWLAGSRQLLSLAADTPLAPSFRPLSEGATWGPEPIRRRRI